MKKEFKSDNILDYKTYKEFYDTFNFKFIKWVNLFVIYMLILVLIKDGSKEVIPSIILLFIFNSIISLKAKIIYKKNFIDKNLINIHNEVFINERDVILQADNGNKNITLLSEVIEIYETRNLLVLKTNNKSNGGCIINKVNLKGGTLNELKQHLLSNCQNIKKKKIIQIKSKSSVIKILFVLLLITIIICSSYEVIKYYLDDKKTIFEITDGKYSIEAFPDIPIEISDDYVPSYIYALWDEKRHTGVVDEIQKYKVDEDKTLIYIIGKSNRNNNYLQYFIFNYKTNKLKTYLNLQDMNDEDKIIFDYEKEFKLPE